MYGILSARSIKFAWISWYSRGWKKMIQVINTLNCYKRRLVSTTYFTLLLTAFNGSRSFPLDLANDANGSMFSFRSSATVFFATLNGGRRSENELPCCGVPLFARSLSTGSAWTKVWLPPQLTWHEIFYLICCRIINLQATLLLSNADWLRMLTV